MRRAARGAGRRRHRSSSRPRATRRDPTRRTPSTASTIWLWKESAAQLAVGDDVDARLASWRAAPRRRPCPRRCAARRRRSRLVRALARGEELGRAQQAADVVGAGSSSRRARPARLPSARISGGVRVGDAERRHERARERQPRRDEHGHRGTPSIEAARSTSPCWPRSSGTPLAAARPEDEEDDEPEHGHREQVPEPRDRLVEAGRRSPRSCSGADESAVAVIGATTIERPKEKTSRAGTPRLKKSDSVRMNENRTSPAAIRIGPTVSSSRGPRSSASRPNRGESTIITTLAGTFARPASAGEKPRNCR